MNSKKKSEIERIEQIIDALMQVAQGDYTTQVDLSDENDHIDALAMGFNTMVDDLKTGRKFKEENEEIKRLNNQLEEAKQIAEESSRLKSVFISNLSHEIRTPMNGIIGFANLLNEDNLTRETKKNFIQIIINSSNQLLRIIDDILEISKLETGQVRILEQDVNVNDLMVELFNIFNLKSKDNNLPIYLKRTLPDELSIIKTDRLKLSKILSNLLENALKFTNSGYIEFGYKCDGVEIEFYVKDTGIGIGKEMQETIFERFSQIDYNFSRKTGGLGLGLSIAKENTVLLNGNISLQSEKGKGSTFYVSIPYKPLKEGAFQNEVYNKNLNGIFKILIAEDEQVNLLYMETLLKKIDDNIRIIRALNGEEAVNLCKENYPLDLVLMDIKLPVMNGIEATKQIKKIYPELPVIAHSAYSSNAEIEETMQAGFNEYITKPVRKEEIKHVLEQYLYIKRIN